MIKKRLGDILEFQRGYDLPFAKRKDGKYPIISSSGISGYHDDWKLDGENVITGRYGTIGKTYYYNGKCWALNTTLYIKNFKNNSARYIYYLLQCILKKESGSDKSTVPGVNRNDLHELIVPFCKDKNKQNDLISILQTIDHKISLNNAINAELEKVAKLLYDYWFVQFDFPNAEGQPYRASGGKMVYNEQLKRKIPKGWKTIPFSKIIKENKQTLSDDVNKDGMFGLDLSVMPNNTMCLNQRGNANDFDSNRFQLNKYDLLFGSIRPYLRKAGFSPFDGVVNGTIVNFRCKHEQDYSFALCTLTSDGMFLYADTRSRGNGTRMPTINGVELLDYKFPYYQDTALAFNKQVSQYWKMIAVNINQNFELAALRDFLLPLLINGQVTVAASEN
jgi:type I restriction enzyme S subunit